MKGIEIHPKDLATVLAILEAHVPGVEVRAFGSRVGGNARRTSDLDLVLMTERPLPPGRMADLREAFSESDLPFKVDLVDWAATKDRFRKIIEERFVVVQKGKGPDPARH